MYSTLGSSSTQAGHTQFWWETNNIFMSCWCCLSMLNLKPTFFLSQFRPTQLYEKFFFRLQVRQHKSTTNMTIPSFITCDPLSDIEIADERNVFGELSMNTFHQPRDVFRPICNTNHTQPIQNSDQTMCNYSFNQDSWVPPLYRNTSLLSSPSCDDEDSPTGTRRSDNNETVIDLPPDFIPPRHAFLKSERDDLTSQHGDENESSPSGSNGRSVKILSSNPVGLHPNDIVCGRGAPSNLHPGNQVFRSIIKEHETKYLFARRSEKPVIAMDVLSKLNSRGMRFVRRDKDGTFGRQVWVEISEQRAYEKVCQSLREGAPELRRKMLSTSATKNNNNSSNSTSYRDKSNNNTRQQRMNYRHRRANTPPGVGTMINQREKENYTPIPYSASDLITFS